MIEDGATHVGVATDHVIESFRNGLWRDYKTGAGIERVLRAQFEPLEVSLAAMGVAVWPMIEFEADDALAAAAHFAAQDERVEKVCIWTPDKDLAQCVVTDRVVQVDGRRGIIRDAEGVRAKFGVAPEFIADYLALVGDAADGYPGIAGYGPKTAASVINRYGPIEDFPLDLLKDKREHALLFKTLATLRIDAPLDIGSKVSRRGPVALDRTDARIRVSDGRNRRTTNRGARRQVGETTAKGKQQGLSRRVRVFAHINVPALS